MLLSGCYCYLINIGYYILSLLPSRASGSPKQMSLLPSRASGSPKQMRVSGDFSLLRQETPLLLSEKSSWSQQRQRELWAGREVLVTVLALATCL